MTKAEADRVIDEFRKCGVKNWVYHCANGDIRQHNSESAFSIHKEDAVYMVELSRNYSNMDGGEFTIRVIPYDKVDSIDGLDITYDAGTQIVKDFGLENDEIKQFLKTMPKRTILNTDAKAGYEGPILNESGKVTVPKGMSGYVVR